VDSEVWGDTTVLTPSAVQQVRTDTNILTAPPTATPTAIPTALSVHQPRGDKPHPHPHLAVANHPTTPMTALSALSARLFTSSCQRHFILNPSSIQGRPRESVEKLPTPTDLCRPKSKDGVNWDHETWTWHRVFWLGLRARGCMGIRCFVCYVFLLSKSERLMNLFLQINNFQAKTEREVSRSVTRTENANKGPLTLLWSETPCPISRKASWGQRRLNLLASNRIGQLWGFRSACFFPTKALFLYVLFCCWLRPGLRSELLKQVFRGI